MVMEGLVQSFERWVLVFQIDGCVEDIAKMIASAREITLYFMCWAWVLRYVFVLQKRRSLKHWNPQDGWLHFGYGTRLALCPSTAIDSHRLRS